MVLATCLLVLWTTVEVVASILAGATSAKGCQIIVSDRTYSDACSVLGLPSLHVRRQELFQKRFRQLTRNN